MNVNASDSVELQTDIPYGPLPEHKLDLHIPSRDYEKRDRMMDGPLQVICFIHGGAWRS